MRHRCQAGNFNFLGLVAALLFLALPAKGSDSIDILHRAVADRLAVMADVALYKWQNHLAIDAPEREAQVLTATIDQALKTGLSPVAANRAVAAQMEAAKKLQAGYFANWQAGQVPTRQAPGLATEIRPKINILTTQFLAALNAAQNDLSRCDAQQRLKALPENPSGFGAEISDEDTSDIWQSAIAGLIPPGNCHP